MFVLLFGLTLRAAKAAAAIVVLAMVAYSHHAAEDREVCRVDDTR